MGGAQDRQQEIVSKDLSKEKVALLKNLIEDQVPTLLICGAYQLLGNYYKEADGNIIDGLGILDLYTENPGVEKRLIGNIAVDSSQIFGESTTLLGFENHGGRTYLGEKIKPLGRVLKGFGNNGKDHTEGAVFHKTIGSYLHGPILPKNPVLADYLIENALTRKYKKTVLLKPLSDIPDKPARHTIAKRLGIEL